MICLRHVSLEKKKNKGGHEGCFVTLQGQKCCVHKKENCMEIWPRLMAGTG